MYAIIRQGSKQYRVEEGDEIEIDLQKMDEGNSIQFDEVLLLSDGQSIKVGTPHLNGAVVEGEILNMTKGPKVFAFKYIKRKSSSRKVGHRQKYSRVKITKIKGMH